MSVAEFRTLRPDDPFEAPTSPEAPPLLVDSYTAARVLSISLRKLWDLMDSGEIPVIRIGRSVRYSVDDLREWIRTKKTK